MSGMWASLREGRENANNSNTEGSNSATVGFHTPSMWSLGNLTKRATQIAQQAQVQGEALKKKVHAPLVLRKVHVFR